MTLLAYEFHAEHAEDAENSSAAAVAVPRVLRVLRVRRPLDGRSQRYAMRELDDVTGAIIDASMRIHRDLGPGLLESVYESVLARALTRRGFHVARQQGIGFVWDGELFEEGFRADLIVDQRVIVELKSVERITRVHAKQLLTYLRLSGLRIGLLLNFGAETMKDGLHRIVNDLPASASPRLRVNQPSVSP